MVLGQICHILTGGCVVVVVVVSVVVTQTLSIVCIANATTNNANNFDKIFKF
jgi:hypothetical protein